jgi:hypothetical protein
MNHRRMKCVTCGEKPAVPNLAFCHNCQAKLDAERARLKQKPEWYVTYEGYTVAIFRIDGKLTPKLIKRDESKLPKSRTLNLNTYLPGYTREQIKNLKRAVLRMACA